MNYLFLVFFIHIFTVFLGLMKISLSFIKKYIAIDLPLADIAEILTLAGLEVDNIENAVPSFSNVVAAKVLSTKKHPQADKLTLAKVFDGKNTFDIVCGAPNCRENLHVALAKEGATLTDKQTNKTFTIKKCTLRGETSYGMLCSEKELNLSQNNEGILELSPEIALGEDLAILVDPIFEISLTPNLSRCMCALGIAKELAAITHKKVQMPDVSYQEKGPAIEEEIQIHVDDYKICPRYSAKVIKNIQLVPSPLWLKRYLQDCDMRSVNVIVDILNFVMLETNQPMHAFDLDKIHNKSLSIQKTTKDTVFFGLDDQRRTLYEDTITINDSEKILAIGGILGSSSSCVEANTKNILLESACFDSVTIRKACRKMQLSTDSSYRFERQSDPNATCMALDRACHLIQKICGGDICQGTIDNKQQEFLPLNIDCRISRINALIGTNLSVNEIQDIFQRLEFTVTRKNEDIFTVTIPTYRNDISQEIDLIEEVARIFGYNNIEKKKPLFHTSSTATNVLCAFERKIKETLIKQQLQEIVTCDLISPHIASALHGFCKDFFIEVLHSKSQEQTILRPSLLPSFLEVIRHNQDFQRTDLHGFEISYVHMKKDNKYNEELMAGIFLTGKKEPLHFSQKSSFVDFYDLKAILESLFAELNVKNISFQNSCFPNFHPHRQTQMFLDAAEIGIIGQVHPSTLQYFSIDNPVYFAEINLQSLVAAFMQETKIAALSTFPSSERDWTLSLQKEEEIAPILKKIWKTASSLLEKVDVIDLYIDPKKPETKNITLRLTYRDKNKTLSFKEVEKEHQKIVTSFEKNI